MAEANAANNLKAISDEYKMRQDPEKYRDMIQKKITKIQNETKNKKRNAFSSAFNEMGRHIEMEQNAINYSGRNEDLVKINQHNLSQVSSTLTNLQYNKDLSRRQAEINDWYYQDKLETLFFLQMFFMTLLSMSIIYWLNKSGMVSSAFAGFATFVLLIIVGIAGVYRYAYTSTFRDPRWWYKRRFGKPVYTEEKKCGCVDDPFVPPKVRCPAKDDSKADCISGMSGNTPIGQIMMARGGNTAMTQLAGVLAKDQQTVNGTSEDTLDRAQNQLEAETIAYMQGKNPPKRPSGAGPEGACPAAGAPIEQHEPGSTNVALNQKVLPYF